MEVWVLRISLFAKPILVQTLTCVPRSFLLNLINYSCTMTQLACINWVRCMYFDTQ